MDRGKAHLLFGAFSQRSTCNIHSGIACTDHCQMFAQIIYIGINEIINGKVDVTQLSPGIPSFLGRHTPVPIKIA